LLTGTATSATPLWLARKLVFTLATPLWLAQMLVFTFATTIWQARKLVFTSADRSISYYEANRGSYELSGRVYASGTMGVPQTLTLVTNESGARGRR